MDDIAILKKLERFFQDAFAAKSAKLIANTPNTFTVNAVFEIETTDGRGTIYIAQLTKK